MELTSDLMTVQSMLTNLLKSDNSLTTINYRGGNEDKILTVMIEIQKFLKSKDYLTEENKPNPANDKSLSDITLFLALNTAFKVPLKLEDYSHLTIITPPLSKCLFVNVVYGLDLCKYYCNVINILPINFCVELLDEVLHCLKLSSPSIQLEYTKMFLKAVSKKLLETEYSLQVQDYIDNLYEITIMMLHNLTGIESNQLKDMNQDKIYKHMGFCLLALLEFLIELEANQNATNLKKFLENIMKTCIFIIYNVTLNVFCTWAEVKIDEEVLQLKVANKAYLFVEKYNENPAASELISKLSMFAKKPKSLSEKIYEADLDTVIKKINSKDSDQASWFKALFEYRIFENDDALECLRTWSHLCNENESAVLLNWCVDNKSVKLEKIMFKCVANLNLEQLKVVLTGHFYRNKFLNLGEADIDESLIKMINKIKENHSDIEGLSKEILLLFLRRPEIVLSYLFRECLKNTFYLNIFKQTFDAIKKIVQIQDLGANVFLKVAFENKPTSNNVNNYIDLLNAFKEMGFYTNDIILLKILNPLLKNYHEKGMLEELDQCLQIFIGLGLSIPFTDSTHSLVILILTIMNECRCKFLNFDGLKQRIAKHTVDICRNGCKPAFQPETEIEIDIKDEDDFTSYYKLHIFCGEEKSMLQSFCANFDINNYGSCVQTLLKVFPPAVSTEWLDLSMQIIYLGGYEKTLELLTDVMILLAQLIETQNIEENKSLLYAMKYCVQNYGLVIQQNILPDATLDTEIHVNKEICRLLKSLPAFVKEEEGLSLVNLLTDRSLKALVDNKTFLCQLILINDSNICKVIAQRMKE